MRLLLDTQTWIWPQQLPGSFHEDPADRLLVAAARMADLTLVTADERILGYSAVRSLDARR